MSEFETNHEDEIVCPYCGQRELDSWEYTEEDDEYECGSCGRTSVLAVHIRVTYSTITMERSLQSEADSAGRIAARKTGEGRERWLARQEECLRQLAELTSAREGEEDERA